jgi:hypothetical protein
MGRDDSDDPIFNDDLLANPTDRDRFTKLFPSVIHVLDDPDLQDYFKRFNVIAGNAKSKSRKWGGWAIILGTAAILLAGAEIIVDQHVASLKSHIGGTGANVSLLLLASVAAAFGIISVLVGGFGILFGKRKREWLHNRFMGETIRQFHFQSMIARLPEILASLHGQDDNARNEARGAFQSKRRQWLSEFQDTFRGRIGPMFEAVIGLGDSDGWRHTQRGMPALGGDHPELEPLFAAYRLLRFEHQRNYATYKLQMDHRILFSSFPRRQMEILQAVGAWGIGMLFSIHILVLLGVVIIALVELTLSGQEAPTDTFSPVSGFLNAVIISIPVLVLATRAFENGLMPESEIDRYEKYRAGVEGALRQYDESKTQAERLVAMRQLERLAFEEMRDFLRTNSKSVFVI